MYSNQDLLWVIWIAACGVASVAAALAFLTKVFGAIWINKWAFEMDHKGREKFVKV